MKILAITGNAHHGKTTLAEQLEIDAPDYGFIPYKTAFAKKLKEIVKEILNVEKLTLEEYKKIEEPDIDLTYTEAYFRIEDWIKSMKKRYGKLDVDLSSNALKLKISEVASYAFTYHHSLGSKVAMARLILQKFGTEIGRYIIPTIWIDFLIEEIGTVKHSEDTLFIIDDLRFIDESEVLGNLFYEELEIIGVTRPDVSSYNHSSEDGIATILERASLVLNVSLEEIPQESKNILEFISDS